MVEGLEECAEKHVKVTEHQNWREGGTVVVKRRKKQDEQQCPVLSCRILRGEPLASVLDLAVSRSSMRGASWG